ncbi:MAG: phosphatidylinositol mannoside acyltransferase [Acidimicrobiales bacterium]
MDLPHPAYVAYRTGSAVARRIPPPLLTPTAQVAGAIARRAMAERAHLVARHQMRVRPDLTPAELRAAVAEAFESYAYYWAESFRLPGTPPEVLDANFDTEGFEHIRAGYEAGKGVVLCMPHLGLWEWAAFWTTTFQGIPVSAVVEPVEPPELARWFVGLREALGMEVIPLGPKAGAAAAASLAQGRILTLMSDRDVAGGGIDVEFFGERTTLPGGPATLALRSGAPLIASTVWLEGGRHKGIALPPLDTSRQGRLRDDVARVTQDLAHAMEHLIRLAPTQWHLMQPNWPSDLAAEAG